MLVVLPSPLFLSLHSSYIVHQPNGTETKSFRSESSDVYICVCVCLLCSENNRVSMRCHDLDVQIWQWFKSWLDLVFGIIPAGSFFFFNLVLQSIQFVLAGRRKRRRRRQFGGEKEERNPAEERQIDKLAPKMKWKFQTSKEKKNANFESQRISHLRGWKTTMRQMRSEGIENQWMKLRLEERKRQSKRDGNRQKRFEPWAMSYSRNSLNFGIVAMFNGGHKFHGVQVKNRAWARNTIMYF